MEVFYTDFSKAVGYNYKNSKKPFYLLSNMYFIVQYANKRIREKIPQGYESDGTTLPEFVFFILGCSHNPQYLPAALIHDWIINNPEIVKRNRKLSSRIFKQCLINEGVAEWKINLLYWGVEFGQWFRNFFVKRWV